MIWRGIETIAAIIISSAVIAAIFRVVEMIYVKRLQIGPKCNDSNKEKKTNE
jgi:hypothetical protein